MKTIYRPPQSGFTLVELLIVIAIIGLLASTVLFAMAGVLEEGRATRTRTQIAKLHDLIMEKYEDIQNSPVRPNVPPGNDVALYRLMAIRELLRFSLPDRSSDVLDNAYSPGVGSPPTFTPSLPAVAVGYRRKAKSTWTVGYQDAECLYLIVSAMVDERGSALEFFPDSEIGDVDNDGMRELLDAWKRPIRFLRWAPGYSAQVGPDGAWGVATVDDDGNGIVDDTAEAGWPGTDDVPSPSFLQSGNASQDPDYLDPLKKDYRWPQAASGGGTTAPWGHEPFRLYPHIFSMGRDGVADVVFEPNSSATFQYVKTTQVNFASNSATTNIHPNDPYHFPLGSGANGLIGSLRDNDSDGPNWLDNISNHQLEIK